MLRGIGFESEFAVWRPVISGAEVLCGRPWLFTANDLQNIILRQPLLAFPMFLT